MLLGSWPLLNVGIYKYKDDKTHMQLRIKQNIYIFIVRQRDKGNQEQLLKTGSQKFVFKLIVVLLHRISSTIISSFLINLINVRTRKIYCPYIIQQKNNWYSKLKSIHSYSFAFKLWVLLLNIDWLIQRSNVKTFQPII